MSSVVGIVVLLLVALVGLAVLIGVVALVVWLVNRKDQPLTYGDPNTVVDPQQLPREGHTSTMHQPQQRSFPG
ncbi:hypothetical protein ACSDQ9_08360 [Aestuariimicrobium soli]|uniref:hypothetical protein n=1 Tax=Aestuariimicrobium soli TaxID=2035834 RepID=UPI003EB9AEB4